MKKIVTAVLFAGALALSVGCGKSESKACPNPKCSCPKCSCSDCKCDGKCPCPCKDCEGCCKK